MAQQPAPQREKPRPRVVRFPPQGNHWAVLPTAITTLTIFFGLLALSYSARAQWESACLFLLFAAFMDVFDGAAARLTQSTSEFGAEYDSMADIISFGVVPAVMVMLWTQSDLGQLAFWTPTIYVMCTAFRLARFNVHKGTKQSYQGLPSPTAALFLTSFVWLMETAPMQFYAYEYPATVRTAIAVTTVLTGAMMISNIPFPRLNSLRSRQGHTPFSALLVVAATAAIFTLIFANPPVAVFGLSSSYVAWGLVNGVTAWRRRGDVDAAEAALQAGAAELDAESREGEAPAEGGTTGGGASS